MLVNRSIDERRIAIPKSFKQMNGAGEVFLDIINFIYYVITLNTVLLSN
jgi:hypothetical protein